MSAAISSRCWYTRSRNAKKMLLRAMSGMSRQAGKAAFGGGDRRVDLGGAAARHAADHLAGRRVEDGPGVLERDLDGRAVDPVGQDRAGPPSARGVSMAMWLRSSCVRRSAVA